MQQVQGQQQAVSPMMMGSPHMRRPPSTGSLNSPQLVQNQMGYGGGGSGGGGASNVYPVPMLPPDGYVYRKPGLFGGAPIHGYSRNHGAKRLPTQAAGTSAAAAQSTASTTNSPVVIVTRSEGIIKDINNVTILKRKPTVKATSIRTMAGQRIIHRGGKVANIMRQEDFDDASNASTISSPGNLTALQTAHMTHRNIKRTVSDSCYAAGEMLDEEVVIIDSSPDEKQRIMDYDDDNDRSVIGTEVSLSSVAQSVVDADDVSVMYDASTSEYNIVSSPLEPEVVEEYQLFPCVADYVDDSDRHTIGSPTEDDAKSLTLEDDSDDDSKDNHNSESPIYLDEMANSDEHFATTEEDIMSMNSEIIVMESNMKSSDDRLHTTSEDFEAMIDSDNSKDGKESNSSVELMEIEPSEQPITPIKATRLTPVSKDMTPMGTVITVVVPSSTSSSSNKPQIVSYSRRPITATAILNAGNATVGNVRTVYTTVNQSASTYNLVKDATPAKYLLGERTISVPILKNATFTQATANKSGPSDGGAKKIIGLTNMTGKKINASNFVTIPPLNIQHQPVGRIVLRTQSSPQTFVQANQRRATIVATETPQITKTLPPTLTYSKISSLSSLKVTQDVSLPTKIFDDESISPDSSIEQDESDMMLTETIYTNDDSNSMKSESNDTHLLTDTLTKTSSNSSHKSIPSPSSLSNQDRIIEVDEMLNDDWKRKSTSSSPVVKPESHLDDTSNSDKSQDMGDKQKAVIPVHVIIKSRESSQSPSLQPMSSQRAVSLLPQLSPLSQPNEITSNMANASQQLRSIMSSISNVSNQATASFAGRLSTIEVDTSVNINKTTKTISVVPTTFENVLTVSNKPVDGADKAKKIAERIITTTASQPFTTAAKTHSTGPATTTLAVVTTPTKILTSNAFNPNATLTAITVPVTTTIGASPGVAISTAVATPTTSTAMGSILVVKQLRTVAPIQNRSRSPITVNAVGNKTQNISIMKSSMVGAQAVIISGQSAQPGSSVIITQNKLPIAQLAKLQSEAANKLVTTANATGQNTIAVATSNQVVNDSAKPTMSILSSTLSQPQQTRIIPYQQHTGEGQQFTITKKPNVVTTRPAVFTTKSVATAIVTNTAVTSANSTAAIQNILQSTLYQNKVGGSILSATLSQPQHKQTASLLQTQLANNVFRRSKSTDEVPGFLKETPAQIVAKRHSSMEQSWTNKTNITRYVMLKYTLLRLKLE